MRLLLFLPFLFSCTPTVKIATDDKPIEINLNVKIEHNIRVKVDKDVSDLIDKNDEGIF